MTFRCGLVSARFLLLGLSVSFVAPTAYSQDNSVTISTVATNAYGTGDINSCAIALNNLTTVGNFQFIGYYTNSGNLMIGRRALGSSTWQTYKTGITVSTGDMADDHNVIALAIDSAGKMHLSWNMHNQALNYAISNTTVTDATLSSLTFTKQTSANAPTLFPRNGSTTNRVTYPLFFSIPDSDRLLFTYRNGGAGGGSGNGNQHFSEYDPGANAWTNRFVINGTQTTVNGYLNSLAYTSTGDLLMSWTWRETPNWQTNSNIMFAQSPDNGTTWYKQGGTTPYTLPIIQKGTPASSVGQVIKTLPQNSSLINQTSMTVDKNNNPIIATYYTPNWNPSTNTGDPNRQYMLVYYTGTEWKTSQITNRTSDTAIDTSGANVRDLGRPIVLVDNQNRTLVVTRSQDTKMGSYSNPSTPGNNIVVYWTDNLSSANPTWNSLTLDTLNMGSWEPTYDANLWATQNKLALVYTQVGLTGETLTSLKVLEWDEQAYFTSVTEPESDLFEPPPIVLVLASVLLASATVAWLMSRRFQPRSAEAAIRS